jgi:flagellar biosynthesis chaperone FliJ
MMTASPSEALKELTSTLYALKGLTQELEKERDIIVTSAGQISTCTRQFQTSIQTLKDLSPEVTQQLNTTLQQSAALMAKQVAEETVRLILEKTTNQIEVDLKKVQDQCLNVNHQLSSHSEKMRFFSRTTLILVLLSTLIGGGIGGGLVHYFIPPLSQLTKTQLEYGEFMLKVWPKMGSKDQEKLIALSKSAKKYP